MSARFAAVLGTLLLAGGGATAAIPGPRDPDWPCFQIKVAQLSPATMWTGPAIDAPLKTWSQDQQVSLLVGRLVQRRLTLDEAQREIAAFAVGDPNRDARLVALFAGLFDTLNQERASVQAGLDRYGARQKELATDIHATMDALHQAQDMDNADQAKVGTLTDALTWQTRVFEARRQSIATACDVPNVIEQRLYALAQMVQRQMGAPKP
jgi:hypothetical protein